MLEREQIENILKQVEDSMGTLHAGRMGAQMEVPGISNNISRLGIARSVLLAVLEGTNVNVALHADELHEEAVIRFDPNVPAAEMAWWRNFKERVEEKQGAVFPYRSE